MINCFIYEQTNRLTSKIYERYGDNPCFPWEKYSGCGVFKNPDNNKWYALVMNIDKSKLDEKRSGEVEIMNIKLSKDKITNLVKQQGFYPAYHMNKKNWITIILNNTLSDDFLLELVEESHNFTLRNNSKNKTGKDI
ncbi:MAG: MmcQ/YjbR family DNA-binding protein [Alphaproteobacteria bacterium]|nr:MmcQ/YjbR family DNA-binding protein [Alphaproteobacteria bacterium]